MSVQGNISSTPLVGNPIVSTGPEVAPLMDYDEKRDVKRTLGAEDLQNLVHPFSRGTRPFIGTRGHKLRRAIRMAFIQLAIKADELPTVEKQKILEQRTIEADMEKAHEIVEILTGKKPPVIDRPHLYNLEDSEKYGVARPLFLASTYFRTPREISEIKLDPSIQIGRQTRKERKPYNEFVEKLAEVIMPKKH